MDRDGVLNIDHGYVSRRQDFEWVAGAEDSIRRLGAAGYRTVVVTNQSGIGRGLYTLQDFLSVSEWMLTVAPIDAITYCPHKPDDECPARKPGTGMFDRVELVMGVRRAESFLVGDKLTDLQAAVQFGVQAWHFTGGDLGEFLRVRLAL